MRVSPEAAARARARQEKEQRDREELERAEAERRGKQAGLGEALFGVQGKGLVGGAGAAPVNPFSAGAGGGGSANPFARPGAAAANPFSAAGPGKAQEKAPEPEAESIPTKYSTKDLPKSFAETLSLNNPQQASGPPPPPEPWPPEAEQPKPYPVSYLAEADYETLDPTPAMNDMPAPVIEADDGTAAGGGSGGGEDKNVFESTIDSTFQKFADRLAQNPDQCIRYEFAGQPLLYSKTDAVGKRLHDGVRLPACGGCGGERVFEVQLVPGAIAELEAEEEGLEGMDWGTVVVGVCASDCVPRGTAEGEAGYLEEWVGVQWEELTQRR